MINRSNKFKIIKELNTFAAPLVINNLFNTLISIVLASIVGRISINAISTYGIVDNFIYSLIGVLTVGVISFNIYASRVIEKDYSQFLNWFKSIFILNFIIGVFALIIIFLFSENIMRYIYDFEGRELIVGIKFLRIMSLTILLNAIIFSMTNLLKVRKKTNEILKIGVVSSIIQVILSYIFTKYIFSGDYKLTGIALASVMSLILNVTYYIYILWDDFKLITNIKSSKKLILIKLSIPLVFQEILEGALFSVVIMALIKRSGTDILSAYNINYVMVGVFLTPMYMYCNGLIVLMGEAIGRKDKESVRNLPRVATFLTLFFYVILAVLFYIFKDIVVAYFTDEIELKEIVKNIMIPVFFLSGFQIFFEISKYSLQAIGKEKITLYSTGVINIFTILILLFIYNSNIFNLYTILLFVAFNYLSLAIVFRILFFKSLK
ncbi:MATE family efflux transporter [Miniphocaeibacter halophilus]|uniref:Multidrug transporter MATE n=1 Tax=Miniphocaeibacter halophilus TaxID=2931922 RepID=A0AC61N0R2_9FIRM|nr:MATE family efflux transporter [Miniphocaeibacter halophilus]QQK08613.1 multidrug transporter MATE [Miniphocaeibacter halophilus]